MMALFFLPTLKPRRPYFNASVFTLLALLSLNVCAQKTASDTAVAKPAVAENISASPEGARQALIARSKADMVFVLGGTFQMGDFGRVHSADKMPYSGPYSFSFPMHEVELDSFSISKYKVTFDDFDIFTQATGKPKIAQGRLEIEARKIPKAPAGTNWQDAKDYCGWLAKETGLAFDLPTEAQWEYAARNRGQFVLYATDNGKFEEGKNLPSYDQLQEIQNKHEIKFLAGHPYSIAQFPPSPLGLYDMTGNGSDWMNDWFSDTYYESSPSKNPKGPGSGVNKVKRGIEFARDYVTALTTYRQPAGPTKKILMDDEEKEIRSTVSLDNNFRCVVNQPKPIKP
jgi:formylglycine-generating enzyme